MTATPGATPPPLDSLVGDWTRTEDLPHLFSLRNQWAQAHVNADLTSLSWFAAPPIAGGYRTGVLTVDGSVPRADSLQWAPWGVLRKAKVGTLEIISDTRLEFEQASVLWQIEVTNNGDATRVVNIEQELVAPFAISEGDWGWLYGTPWNAGHHHDYFATERIRDDVDAEPGVQSHVVAPGLRVLRFGMPRRPGIQRDEDESPMLLEYELPDHTAPAARTAPSPAALGRSEGIVIRAADGSVLRVDGPFDIDDPRGEIAGPAVELGDGSVLEFTFTRDERGGDGVILTHGNHPDSLRFSIEANKPVLYVGGERVLAERSLDAGAHRWSAAIRSDGVRFFIDDEFVGVTAPWWRSPRWSIELTEAAVVTSDAQTTAVSAFSWTSPPDSMVVDGARALASWRVSIGPGESLSLGVVLAIGQSRAEVEANAAARASNFAARHAGVAQRWRELWTNAFREGNPDHSGHLPVLSADPDLEKTYYLGILLALYMRNTKVSRLGPVFLTGGPRLGPTITFYWDISEWPRTAALLEPRGMRAWILAALASPYETSHSFDTRNFEGIGNHYAANDYALFRTVESYVCVTGDTAILDELAGGRTVVDHLRGFAWKPATAHHVGSAGVIVDMGDDAWELLECVPNYRHGVASFNAGYVGLLRSLADLESGLGNAAEAERATLLAQRLSAAVMDQFDAGRWRIVTPRGHVTIGHCLDFELTAANLSEDLDARDKEQMAAFVTSKLLDGDWMRALAPDDPIAPLSDRPDHGAAGAFAGWPGSTAYGLARIGRSDIAAAFLRRIHRARSGALWGQAVEAVGDGRFATASRGVANRDSNAAVAATEAVIAGLFGVTAHFGSVGEGGDTGAYGVLTGLSGVGFDRLIPRLLGRSRGALIATAEPGTEA